MSAEPQGIKNWSKLNDFNKSYLVKLLGTIFVAIITGIITGNRQLAGVEGITNGWLGLLILIGTLVGFSFLIKSQFDLSDMTDMRIIRHGILICSLSFLFFWVVVFNFIYP